MGLFSALFGGGQSKAIREASEAYQKSLADAMTKLRSEEALGRGELGTYYQQALGLTSPYREAGTEALEGEVGALGLGAPGAQKRAYQQFQESPGYKFALNQAIEASRRGAAARGLTGSGAEERELARTGAGFAEQQFGQYENRLAQLAGRGEQAAEFGGTGALETGRGLAGLGTQYGGLLAQLYGARGEDLARSILARQQAHQGLLSRIGQFAGTLVGGGGLLQQLT